MSPDWANAIASAFAAVAGTGSALVAWRTYRHQHAGPPPAPAAQRLIASESIRNQAGARLPPRTVRATASVPATRRDRSTPTPGFLIGVGTVAAIVAIELVQPRGFSWGTAATIAVGWATAGCGVTWMYRLIADSVRTPNARFFGALIATILPVATLGSASILVYNDFKTRIDSCVAFKEWSIVSHVTGPNRYQGTGGKLSLDAEGYGVLIGTDEKYERRDNKHSYRRQESFYIIFDFAAHGGTFTVDRLRSAMLPEAKEKVDDGAWKTITPVARFPGLDDIDSAYTCTESSLKISTEIFAGRIESIEATRAA